jgi:CRISPR-associated exonuclease Cas4
VKGVIDAVEETDGLLIPVEYKKGKMGKHLNDHFQLCAAALCLEEKTGKSIAYGEIFYYGNRRRQKS